jgi:tol-pal system protein YbgF
MAGAMFKGSRRAAAALLCLIAVGLAPAARAGIFDDDEARKAILDLRQRLEQSSQKIEQGNERARALQAEQISRLSDQITQNNAQSAEQIATLKRSLLDLNSQLELLRGDIAKLRGQDEQRARDYEQLTRSVAELQRKQKDITEGVEDRIRKIEPQKVTVDDKEFLADPDEKRIYEEAMASLRKGEFDKAAPALSGFLRRYPVSGYAQSAQFWLGNALYGKRDYKDAIASFRALVSAAPEHPRAAEALLAVANCEIELKDVKSARKTIAELVKAYPKSEAAQAGRDRLVTLK